MDNSINNIDLKIYNPNLTMSMTISDDAVDDTNLRRRQNSLDSNGNYDAMFGYIKNYQWSARMDGGYDCQTTVISTGEIIESLKVNYVRPDLHYYKLYDVTSIGNGYLNEEFSNQGPRHSTIFQKFYEKNTIAGMWAELYLKLLDALDTSKGATISSGSILRPEEWKAFNYPALQSINTNNDVGISAGSNYQIYISLGAAFKFIEKYIIPRGSKGEPVLKISLKSNKFGCLWAIWNIVSLLECVRFEPVHPTIFFLSGGSFPASIMLVIVSVKL